MARIRLYDTALTEAQASTLDRLPTASGTYTISGTVTRSGTGLAGVTLQAGGAAATSDSTGAYTITGLGAGTYTVTPSLSGYSFTPGSKSVTISAANVSGVSFTASAAAGPVPKADYRFQNSLASSVGSAPALTNVGSGTNTFATETVDGVSRTVLTFPSGNGVLLSGVTGVVPASTYSMVMLFRVASTSGYVRIVDVKTPGQDNGLFCLNGQLNMYPLATGPPRPSSRTATSRWC